MRTLELQEMETLNGGIDAGDVMCGIAVAGFIVSAGALLSTGVGAPLAGVLYSAAGYSLSTAGLTGCFL